MKCRIVWVNCFILLVVTYSYGTALPNADHYLNIPTPYKVGDDSGEVAHPSVVYFPGGWNSWKYWMAFTPFPEPSSYENPCIVVSNDGFNWQVPLNLTNPIDSTPYGHNCDADMLYDSTTNELWYYWMDGGNGTSYLKLSKSSDGINWTKTKILITTPDYLVSPAVVITDTGFLMWGVRTVGGGDSGNRLEKWKSSDGENDWELVEDSVGIYNPGFAIWHLDIEYIPNFKEYWALYVSYFVPFDYSYSEVLFFSKSSDGENWKVYKSPVLNPAQDTTAWDSKWIYRSTCIYDVSNNYIRVWYSAHSWNNNPPDECWRIGHTENDYDTFCDSLFVEEAQVEETQRENKDATSVPCIREGMTVFPSIANQYVNIKLSLDEEVLITDAMGRIVKKVKPGLIHVFDFKTGIYFVVHKQDRNQKFIVIK